MAEFWVPSYFFNGKSTSLRCQWNKNGLRSLCGNHVHCRRGRHHCTRLQFQIIIHRRCQAKIYCSRAINHRFDIHNVKYKYRRTFFAPWWRFFGFIFVRLLQEGHDLSLPFNRMAEYIQYLFSSNKASHRRNNPLKVIHRKRPTTSKSTADKGVKVEILSIIKPNWIKF